jgi:hypothetical protein
LCLSLRKSGVVFRLVHDLLGRVIREMIIRGGTHHDQASAKTEGIVVSSVLVLTQFKIQKSLPSFNVLEQI